MAAIFTDNIFKFIFFKENHCVFIEIPLEFAVKV